MQIVCDKINLDQDRNVRNETYSWQSRYRKANND